MNIEILPIILGLIGVLGGGGLWGYIQSRKDAPVRQRDADIAAAEKSQQMALAVADDLREDVGRLRDELTAERTERRGLSAEVRQLHEQVDRQHKVVESVRRAFNQLSEWVDGIINDWDTVRLSESAPQKPTLRIDDAELPPPQRGTP